MAASEIEILKNIRTSAVRSRDSTTNATNTIDYAHHEVHGGNAYASHYTEIDVDTGEVVRVRFETANTAKWPHILMSAITTLSSRAIFIEETTLQHVAANAITAYNRDRNSTNTSGMTICHTPIDNSSSSSGETVEVILEQQTWGTAGKGTSPGFGGTVRGSSEWILKPNTAYLIEVVSLADNNIITVSLDWYEHTNK